MYADRRVKMAEPTDAHGVGGRTDFETSAIIADPVSLDVMGLIAGVKAV